MKTNTKKNHNLVYSAKPIILVSALLLSACNDSSSDNSVETTALTSALNLTELSAANVSNEDGSGTVRQMSLTWESAAEDSSASGITYTICQTEDNAENSCSILAKVTDTLTTSIELDSLIDALSHSYFVIADNGSETVSSSEMSLDADTISEMIGYFKGSNTDAGDDFGYYVAMSADGNTLAIGAYSEDYDTDGIADNASNSGAVYVFNHDGSSWSQVAYLKADDAQASDSFGKYIALSADGLTLAIGAVGEDAASTGINGEQESATEVKDDDDNIITEAVNYASGAGAVYIFTNTGATWAQSAYIKASNSSASDQFGTAIALNNDGSILAVSAPFEDSASTSIDGEQLSAAEVEDDEDNIISEAVNYALNAGAVYLFTHQDSTWAQTTYIKGSNTEAGDFFGKALAFNGEGDTLIVSAWGEDSSAIGVDGDETNNDIASSGAAYIFSNDGNNWSQTAYLKASNIDAFDGFGYTVSMNDNGTLVSVSSYSEDSNATGIDGDDSNGDASAAGAVYLFTYDGSNWDQSAYVKASNSEKSDAFGFYSAQLSADGLTLAVGATKEDSAATGLNGDQENNDASSAGAVFLYRYENEIWQQTTYVKASNTTAGDAFGVSIALSEDGNTLAVGADNEDSAATGINGEQSALEETLDDDGNVLIEASNYASGAGAVYLY